MRFLTRLLRWIRSSPLGRRDVEANSAWQVVLWWEARRLAFNVVVGAAGIVSAVLILATAIISERLLGIPVGLPDPPFLAILGAVAFVVGANICYTGGWIGELVVRWTWPDESDRFATLMFALGLPFAAVVTLVPAALIILSALAIGLARGFR